MLKKFFKNLKIKKISITKIFKKKKSKLEIYKEQLQKEKKQKRVDKKQFKLNFKKINYKKLLLNIFIYFVIIILFVLNSSFLKVKTINIIALDSNVNSYLIEKNLSYLIQKLIFKIDKNSLEKKIYEIEQNLKSVKIRKKYSNTINIELSSFPTIFSTQIKNKNYLITLNGVFIPKKNIKYKNIDPIELKYEEIPNFPLYKKILKQENLEKIIFIKDKLKENILGLQIKKIIYYKVEKEVHFIINNNSRIIFDLVGDTKEKLKQLYVFNKETKNIVKPGIIYIDNRIIGKIYYCEEENKKICHKNLDYIYK